MTEVRWRNLDTVTRQRMRRAGILNGCGAKGHWLDPPDWLFKASCDHHDFNYWLGCSDADRRRADWQFYQAMVEDANNTSWWRRPFARLRAWIYYKAVVKWGEEFFYFASGYRTWEDLLAELERAGA